MNCDKINKPWKNTWHSTEFSNFKFKLKFKHTYNLHRQICKKGTGAKYSNCRRPSTGHQVTNTGDHKVWHVLSQSTSNKMIRPGHDIMVTKTIYYTGILAQHTWQKFINKASVRLKQTKTSTAQIGGGAHGKVLDIHRPYRNGISKLLPWRLQSKLIKSWLYNPLY